MNWIKKHPEATLGMMGYIQGFLSEFDPRPAREQFDSAYAHGGGWLPSRGFKLLPNGNIRYPGDPEVRMLFEAKLREETIRFYEHAWVMILQPDGRFEICRMD